MATKRDVAKLASVSPSTVSRVINQNGYVSEDVRTRVLQAIRELEYVPNRIARSLRTSESRQIACITHSITNPFYSEILLGVEEASYENGYTFALYNANFDKRNYPQALQEGVQDGIIVMSPVELLDEVLPNISHVPTVVLWDFSSESPIANVRIDLKTAMCQTVTHLIQSGHSQIAFLGLEADTIEQNPRLQGYLECMQEHGCAVNEERILLIPKWRDDFKAGYNLAKQLVHSKREFTAIAASNDLMAVGAIRALTESGIRVPQDVSITGIDDIELAQMISPALTTVEIPKREIGRGLFELLLRELRGDHSGSRSVTYKTRLVIRESVAPPRNHG